MKRFFLAALVAMTLCVSSVRAQSTGRAEVVVGFDNGISYRQRLSDHFLLRYSAGLTLDHRVFPDSYKLDEEGHRVVVSSWDGSGPQSCTYFRLSTISYSIAPFAAVDVRWYPRPVDNDAGFFLYGSVRYIHSGLPVARLQDYDPYAVGHLLFPLGVGYDYRLSDRLTLSLTGDMGLSLAFMRAGKTIPGVFLHESLSLSYRF